MKYISLIISIIITQLNSFSQGQKSQHFYNSLNEVISSQQFILDKVICDFNNDKIKDYILVVDEKKNNLENAQHQAPLPILIIQGVKTGFKLWKKNEHIVEDLDDNCPADGFQKIVSKLNYFTVESTVCQDNFYLTHFTTFKYSKESDNVTLHKFGIKKINRQNPNQKYVDKIYTVKEFGRILFEEFSIEKLKLKLKN